MPIPFRRYVVLPVAFIVGALNAASIGAAERNSPEVNYMLHCQGCHLPGGIGHPGIVPSMKGEVGRFLSSDAGRAYLVQVPGVAQSFLDDAQLAEVLNWLLPTFDPDRVPEDFKPYTAEEVGRYRHIQLTNVAETRRQLIANETQ